ncbi:hypothetical protein FNV43_RR26625 [Rhamnella rubrinervis]|uniref:Uncharacterized protein n=1 Tax=Rhamnella rubrinervis TaxID=2594499 RepID=A0A8K0GMP1_9ROSA|nr:hypothetical protein FNV43_RR26625 [Rhamnella rubrinervis]
MPSIRKRVLNNPNEEEIELRRGPWTLEEDTLLIHYIASHGEGHWNMLAKCAGLKRTGKSCRLRWLNYLKPDIKRGNLTPQEQLLILELHSKWGNRWSKIAQQLPGRTDNEIKNYWRTRVQKQARQLNIESNSKTFLDAVRYFWMPRLLQKMEQTSSSTSSSSSMYTQNSSLALDSLPSSNSYPLPSKLIQSSNNPNGYLSSVTNPFVLPSDSIISHIPQISQQYPIITSPDHNGQQGKLAYNNLILEDSRFAGISSTGSYDGMEGGLGLVEPNSGGGVFDISQIDAQMAESDWVLDNMADTLWNMEEM